MRFNKIALPVLSGGLALAMLAGCGSNNGNNAASSSPSGSASAAPSGSASASASTAAALPDIEVWNTNIGFQGIDKDSPMYNFYKEKTGVGITQPYVEWNGGTTYGEQLNLKIAANEMPDMFMPVNGMETKLIKDGALLDLTDLLPKLAPNLWNAIPQEVWDVMRSYDPTGQGRIYTIPTIVDYGRETGLIRQDWLDKLGLQMPTTTDELTTVLQAFKDKDPNGNGQKDELPTGGRQDARWMDQLFAPFGVAILEGWPQWDTYNGELTYSAITPNMKDALAYVHQLYADGLLDKETLLNSKDDWTAKITSNKVGVYYHWAEAVNDNVEKMKDATGVQGDFTVLPSISAPGYEGFYTMKKITGVSWVVKNEKDQSKIDSVMKVLNAYGDKTLWNDFYMGVEGMHYKVENGTKIRLPDDYAKMQNFVLQPFNDIGTVDFKKDLLSSLSTPDRKWAIDQDIRNIQEAQKYVKDIAGDGMPSAVFDGFPDIQNNKLYVEYASKIIIGEYPIDKFDEFVEKWKKSGGDQVTQKARDWYATVKK